MNSRFFPLGESHQVLSLQRKAVTGKQTKNDWTVETGREEGSLITTDHQKMANPKRTTPRKLELLIKAVPGEIGRRIFGLEIQFGIANWTCQNAVRLWINVGPLLVQICIGKHWIQLKVIDFVWCNWLPYWARPKGQEFGRVNIEKELGMNVIRLAQTKWAPQILFAPREYGSIRICVNHRELNSLAVQNHFSMLGINACINSGSDATIFLAVDANAVGSRKWKLVTKIEKNGFQFAPRPFKIHKTAFGLWTHLDWFTVKSSSIPPRGA